MIWRNLLIKRLPNSKHNFNSFLNNQRNILFEQWVHLFSSTPMRHVGCGWYISFLFQFNQTSLLLEFDIGPPGELFQLNSPTNPVTHDYRWGHMLLKVHCDYSNWQSNCVSTLEVCSTYPALGFDLNASSELSWCHQQHTAGKPATFRRKYNTGPLSCDGSVPACSAVSVDENNLTLLHTDKWEHYYRQTAITTDWNSELDSLLHWWAAKRRIAGNAKVLLNCAADMRMCFQKRIVISPHLLLSYNRLTQVIPNPSASFHKEPQPLFNNNKKIHQACSDKEKASN